MPTTLSWWAYTFKITSKLGQLWIIQINLLNQVLSRKCLLTLKKRFKGISEAIANDWWPNSVLFWNPLYLNLQPTDLWLAGNFILNQNYSHTVECLLQPVKLQFTCMSVKDVCFHNGCLKAQVMAKYVYKDFKPSFLNMFQLQPTTIQVVI